ncbi:hypothetical protein Tco_0414055 [Tanacetum coccineum]
MCLKNKLTNVIACVDAEMDLFNLISAPNPTKVKTGTRPRAAHEVPLLIATATRVIAMKDATGLSSSSRTPSTVEKSPLDFSNEDSPRRITERDGTKNQGQETKNIELAKELESLRAKFFRSPSEERIKAAFEEFKRYEDDKVEQRCAEMDARLDKLSIYFDEELYPHMLTAITVRRWLIGHALRLVVLKCVESLEIRQAFADVVSAGLAKGLSEGLQYGIEHGKAGRDLGDVEAYDPEANDKFVKAFQDLKDLKYPVIDQLKRLKDSLIDLIIASLHLESDTGEDAPQ